MTGDREHISPLQPSFWKEIPVMTVTGERGQIKPWSYGNRHDWETKFLTLHCAPGEDYPGCRFFIDRESAAKVLEAAYLRKGRRRWEIGECDGICLWNPRNPRVLGSHYGNGTKHKPTGCPFRNYTPDEWWEEKRGKRFKPASRKG